MITNNRLYWKQRENAHAKQLKQSVSDMLNGLQSEYQQALNDIEDDINRNYIRYAKSTGYTMSDAMKLADKTDVTRMVEKVKKYVKDRDFSKQANKDLKLYNLKIRVSRLKLLQMEIELEIDRLNGKINTASEELLIKQALNEYKRQSTILGKSINLDRDNVKRLVNASYKIAGEGAYTFSDNIWNDMENLKGELKKIINRGILQGKNVNQFINKLTKQFEVQSYQAGRLLITETARIQGDVQLDSYLKSGYKQYEIITEQKACNICKSIASEGPFNLDEAEIGTNMYPFHPNCLCSAVPADFIE